MTSTQCSLFLVNDFSATVWGKLRQSSEGFSAARCKDEGCALLQVCDHKRESLSFICLPTPFPLRAVVCIPLAGKWNSCIMMDSFQHWCNSPLHPAANTVVLLSSGRTRVSFLACLHPGVTLLKISVCTPHQSRQSSWAGRLRARSCGTVQLPNSWVRSILIYTAPIHESYLLTTSYRSRSGHPF